MGWGSSRPDSFTPGVPRRQLPVERRNFGVPHRPQLDDGDLEIRPNDESMHDDYMNGKLDRLLDKLDKFDLWREEADRRFEYLDPIVPRETEPPLGFEDGDEAEYEEFRRKKASEKGGRARHPNFCMRDMSMDDRRRRGERTRGASAWDAPGNRFARTHGGGFPQQFETSCWDPPQRYRSTAAEFDKNQIAMKPPRFDGSDATNWIPRVQYYFNHMMIPDAQRLHYAVMLFDPPASEWVFNYCANIDCVTWHEFLEDVRHNFDRQRDRYRREGRNDRGSCWDPPRYQQHCQQIGGYGQQFNRPATCYDPPQSWQPSCWEPSRGYSDYDQPPLGPPSRGDPPNNRCPQTLLPSKSDRRLSHRTAPLSAVATHPPQQSSKFIDSGKQRGLPNISSLKVCSPYPDEPLQAIVKTDNPPRQVLVGAYDGKIDDLRVPTHKELEMERKGEEEKQGQKELERQKEPEWAKVEELEEEDESEDALEEKKNEFYCVACSQKFRSDKQWKNHEQSKKHKEKVTQLPEAFHEEDIECEAEVDADDGSDIGYLSADDGVSKLGEKFEAGIGIQEDDIIKRITLIRLCAFDPGICVRFSKRNWEFLAMHREAVDLQVEDLTLHIDNVLWNAMNMLTDNDKELAHGGFMKCLLATKTFNIELCMPEETPR
ncbi:uncharacterized protein LOC121797016 [Salvia splendens]|uniref:uncharacterized protein LOC121797016 n=1 Tax=Salvia splendens TaxID=180675 RepID=UPI001C253634|nr:uncharacterized protein LOC121797016 [Salvia splendens]